MTRFLKNLSLDVLSVTLCYELHQELPKTERESTLNESFLISYSPRSMYKRTKYKQTSFRPQNKVSSVTNDCHSRGIIVCTLICTGCIGNKYSTSLYVCTLLSPFLLKTFQKNYQIICLYINQGEIENTNSFSGSQAWKCSAISVMYHLR